jgi:hypothetical protein
LIAEDEFLNDAEAAVAWVREEHRAASASRAEPMARLLTELSDPASFADAVRSGIAAEREFLQSLLEYVDYPPEPWVIDRPGIKVTLMTTPFPAQREELTRTLALIDAEAARCDARLAARKADIEHGTRSRVPDPAEEPDEAVRIWASRLAERAENAQLAAEILQRAAKHTRELIDKRIAFHEKWHARPRPW